MPTFLNRISRWLPLVLIIILAASLRWFNLNWDNGYHLHPDERFLTMVQTELELPTSFQNYLDPNTSTMNPQNQGHTFYVYGTLPLTINKVIAVLRDSDTYDLATPQGRFLSGLADVGTVILVYLLAELCWGGKHREAHAVKHPQYPHVGLWAAGFYAVAVLPIQLSHFFAADSFLCFFLMASLWASWRYATKPHWRYVTQAGIWLGLALASKLTAAFLAPVIGFAILAPSLTSVISLFKARHWDFRKWGQIVAKAVLVGGWWLLMAYCALRLASPNYFATPSWLDPHLNPRFISSLQQLKSFDGDDSWFPPAIQWIQKPPVWFSLKNLALYGVGLPWFGWALVGIGVISWQVWAKVKTHTSTIRDWLPLILTIWIGLFFYYQSTQFVKVMRYFNLIYPGLALLAGVGLARVIAQLQQLTHLEKGQSRSILSTVVNSLIGAVIVAILIWPAAFMSIYMHKHSRVTASEWLDQNLPDKSSILSEYWDDGLPLPLPAATKTFTGEQIAVFDQDSPEKWTKLSRSFMQADYYVLSSNRAWGSIMVLPDKYPQMSAYYRGLLADQTNWQLVQTITNYPSLKYLGIPLEFNTDWADEAFTVYDHPKVLVFGKR